MSKRPTHAWLATVVCPQCGAKHVAPAGKLPERCGCGHRFWSPVAPESGSPASEGREER